MTLTKGTRIYYNGDMANPDGFGTITEEIPQSRFMDEQVKITMDDGREMTIAKSYFSKEYKGHGGTRFVTKAAYDAYMEERRKATEIIYAQILAKRAAGE